MKLEVGMYVRDREEGIGQVDYICDCVECLKRGYKEPVIKFKNHTEYVNSEELEKIWFIKSSFNLIDLIEVGDYVNRMEVKEYINIPYKMLICSTGGKIITELNPKDYSETWISNDEIKSIVTHEQFKSMEYKVEQ